MVTDTLPEVPPATFAVMVVALTTVYVAAGVPPKLTAVAAEKLAPVIVTVVLVPAEVGVNDVMAGTVDAKVKPVWVPVPAGVVTDTLPVVPPATTAFIEVGLKTVYEVAAVPPKLTADALQKPVPVIITVWPVAAVVGVNDVTVGATAADKLKLVALVPVPAGLVTDMVPVAPQGTVAVICVALFTVNATAAVPPKLTAVAPVKLVPVITSVVAPAAKGVVMAVTVGAPIKPASVAVPPGVVTNALVLLVAPEPTTAVMLVELKML